MLVHGGTGDPAPCTHMWGCERAAATPPCILGTKVHHSTMERTLVRLLVWLLERLVQLKAHVERLLRGGRGLLVLHPTKKLLLQSPGSASGARPTAEHGLLPITAIQPHSLVIFTTYITAVSDGDGRAAAFSSLRCWTCTQMFWVGPSRRASRLLGPGHGPHSVLVAVSLVRRSRSGRPRGRGVFCAHQHRLLPLPPRRRVHSVHGSATLPERDKDGLLKHFFFKRYKSFISTFDLIVNTQF